MSVLRRRSNGSVPTYNCRAGGTHERTRVSLVRFIAREHELQCLRSPQNAKIKNSRHQQERQAETRKKKCKEDMFHTPHISKLGWPVNVCPVPPSTMSSTTLRNKCSTIQSTISSACKTMLESTSLYVSQSDSCTHDHVFSSQAFHPDFTLLCN